MIMISSSSGHLGSRQRVQYYVFIQNLPTKYMRSDIFPDILIREEVRDELREMEVHRREGYCVFGFVNKIVCNRFEKEMQKFLPHFVMISRRLLTVPKELKEEREYYDNKTVRNRIQAEDQPIIEQEEGTYQQKVVHQHLPQAQIINQWPVMQQNLPPPPQPPHQEANIPLDIRKYLLKQQKLQLGIQSGSSDSTAPDYHPHSQLPLRLPSSPPKAKPASWFFKKFPFNNQ